METVLRAKNMTKIYGLGSKQPFTALENIDLEIKINSLAIKIKKVMELQKHK